MTWTVYSRSDQSRWLNFAGLGDWVADDETTRELSAPEVAVKLSPVGPYQVGVDTEAKLFHAAMVLIPASSSAGVTPDPVVLPKAPPGVVS